MTLPASVIAMLESQKVNYNIAENVSRAHNNLQLIPSDNEVCVVKSLLLEDIKGRVQVLIPSDKIVDLDSVFRQFHRNFEGISGDALRSLLGNSELHCLPALPHWQNLETYVDASLLKRERLWLESGSDEQMLEVSLADFECMTENASIGKFSASTSVSQFDREKDEEKIRESLKRFTKLRIRQRLEETLELPPLPETAQRIIRLRADPNADINDLCEIVELDPSLAAQVVSWAASPYYSAPGKIKSVHDAIIRVLGFDMVLNLALGLALGKTLSGNCLSPRQVKEYWRNAVYTAAVVEGLVTSIPRDNRPSFGMAYLSGLLNNFGYLILAEIFPPYFNNVERLVTANTHLPSDIVQEHILGVSGNQIAGWLLENWNMPSDVVTAIRQQNNLEYQEDNSVYPRLVYIARRLLANQGVRNIGPTGLISQEIYDSLDLDAQTADITVKNILSAGDDLDAIAEQMRA